MVNYETYCKRVLPQEWYNCWGSLTNGMNSLQAGAVAIRSYTIPRMANYVSSHGGGTYDICTTTCCHVYGTT
ncbi:MAG TPA: SpoIID/LytB domain-containing protein, partial [Bacteroidales bacterium]|nr:SpoIID/LytB domain-containing protein [Bacteroidales bacterium]